MRTPTISLGSEALEAARAGRTYDELAAEVGAPTPTVWRWCKGEQKPLLSYRLELEERFGIDLLDWDKEVSNGS